MSTWKEMEEIVPMNDEEPVNETLAYYNENADSYYDHTVGSDMNEQYDFFLKYLPSGVRLLDFGCGSGRDTKYFMDKGFLVTAIDGSEAMCKMRKAIPASMSVRWIFWN